MNNKFVNHYIAKRFLLFLFLVYLTGCATPPGKHEVDKLERLQGVPKVLILPLDVELYEISVGGVSELKPEWTTTGKANAQAAIEEFLSKDSDIILVPFNSQNQETESHRNFYNLMNAVGDAMLLHYHSVNHHLPTKEKLQWSVGDSTKIFREEYDADYALYVYLRDHFSSSGRIAMGVVSGLLFGAAPGAGMEIGLAQFINLKTGDVVWFNFIRSEGFGDLREPDSAKTAIENLLKELPK